MAVVSCFLSYFIIKPQLCCCWLYSKVCCFLSYFIIKPQLKSQQEHQRACCFLSYFIIKPQRILVYQAPQRVVSYLISSSNHNIADTMQTLFELFLILFHHQTTTALAMLCTWLSCFLSYFIIKPQLWSLSAMSSNVVSYLISSSNHNRKTRKLTS